jgi:hypothetical protein
MKSKLLHLVCGALAVSVLSGCGVMSLEEEEAMETGETGLTSGSMTYPYPSSSPYPSPSPTASPSPSPSPSPGFVTCKTDSLNGCTSDTAGQSCKKSNGSTGTCTSGYLGCGCV